MKKAINMTIIISTSIILVLITYNQLVNRNIETQVIIQAPAEKVWQVLLEHESYNEWNPFIKNISGSTDEGDMLEVTIQGEGNDPMIFKPEVLVNEQNKEFRWKGKFILPGIVDGEHYFILENLGNGKTKFIQGERFTGILSGIFMSAMGDNTEKGFLAMNKALKSKSE